jgi:hypothetical protein
MRKLVVGLLVIVGLIVWVNNRDRSSARDSSARDSSAVAKVSPPAKIEAPKVEPPKVDVPKVPVIPSIEERLRVAERELAAAKWKVLSSLGSGYASAQAEATAAEVSVKRLRVGGDQSQLTSASAKWIEAKGKVSRMEVEAMASDAGVKLAMERVEGLKREKSAAEQARLVEESREKAKEEALRAVAEQKKAAVQRLIDVGLIYRIDHQNREVRVNDLLWLSLNRDQKAGVVYACSVYLKDVTGNERVKLLSNLNDTVLASYGALWGMEIKY